MPVLFAHVEISATQDERRFFVLNRIADLTWIEDGLHAMAVTLIAIAHSPLTETAMRDAMSERYPVKTALPGITNLRPTIDIPAGVGCFLDKDKKLRGFQFQVITGGSDPCLSIVVEDGTVASFKPWPSPHQNSWSASGIHVQNPGKGIAKNIYAAARDILLPYGIEIAPSDNLFDGGKELWARLDPAIEFEERPDMQGFYRPNLTGLAQD